MPITLDAPTISVITSGIVAISTLLFPLLIGLISERLKWAREKKAAEIEGIEKSTKVLMEALSDLWGDNYFRGLIQQQSRREDEHQLRSRVLSSFYEWERIIWRYSNKQDQISIKDLRQEVENFKPFIDQTDEYRLSLSNRIHDFVYRAIAKI
jgi:hypothetical protein